MEMLSPMLLTTTHGQFWMIIIMMMRIIGILMIPRIERYMEGFIHGLLQWEIQL